LVLVLLWSYPIPVFMAVRPPRCTLFPYTTLFRSLGRRGNHRGDAQLARGEVGGGHGRHRGLRGHATLTLKPPHNMRLASNGSASDRKSTRLNSSHVKISYAVFCLKKEKIKILIKC